MLGDGSCGYYAILSQYFPKLYGGDTLGPFNYNEKNNGCSKE
jgi:hypothetical protein